MSFYIFTFFIAYIILSFFLVTWYTSEKEPAPAITKSVLKSEEVEAVTHGELLQTEGGIKVNLPSFFWIVKLSISCFC